MRQVQLINQSADLRFCLADLIAGFRAWGLLAKASMTDHINVPGISGVLDPAFGFKQDVRQHDGLVLLMGQGDALRSDDFTAHISKGRADLIGVICSQNSDLIFVLQINWLS